MNSRSTFSTSTTDGVAAKDTDVKEAAVEIGRGVVIINAGLDICQDIPSPETHSVYRRAIKDRAITLLTLWLGLYSVCG